MYADVRGSSVYFQVSTHQGDTLSCAYGSNNPFSQQPNYYDGYAECSPWTQGNPSYTITLTLSGNRPKTYTTDEDAAVALGPHPSSQTTGINIDI